MAGLLHKLMALDSRAIERGNASLSSPPDPSQPWWWARLMIVRQFLVFGLAWIIAGTGLVAWVTFGGGPLRVLFFAVLLLGMGQGWLVPSVLLFFLLGHKPPSGGSRPNR